MNGLRRLTSFWKGHGRNLKGRDSCGVPAIVVETKKRKTKKVMGEHLVNYGFTPDYTRWIFHGEAHRMNVMLLVGLETC